MEIKNNLKEKAKYFGMYIGNKAIAENDFVAPLIGVEYRLEEYSPYQSEINIGMTISNLKDAKLILKPFSELSNEDSEKVFTINGRINKIIDDLNHIEYRFYSRYMNSLFYDIQLNEWLHLASLGYAIPVNGLYDPFELGWVIQKDFA